MGNHNVTKLLWSVYIRLEVKFFVNKKLGKPENKEDYNNASVCLGKMQLFGEGNRVNYEKAYEFFKDASDNDSKDAYFLKKIIFKVK